MSTLTTTAISALPRVNLLPPEIGEAKAFRKVQAGLGVVVLAACGVVAFLVLAAAAQVAEADESLAATESQTAGLQAEQAKYAAVPAVYAELDQVETQQQLAMGQEIRWSFYLNDLSLGIPTTSWITTLAVAQADPAVAVAAATATSGADPLSVPSVAAVTVSGRATQHVEVANWLESFGKQKGNARALFSTSADADSEVGGPFYVIFESSVVVTADALSQRYTKAGT